MASKRCRQAKRHLSTRLPRVLGLLGLSLCTVKGNVHLTLRVAKTTCPTQAHSQMHCADVCGEQQSACVRLPAHVPCESDGAAIDRCVTVDGCEFGCQKWRFSGGSNSNSNAARQIEVVVWGSKTNDSKVVFQPIQTLASDVTAL